MSDKPQDDPMHKPGPDDIQRPATEPPPKGPDDPEGQTREPGYDEA